MKNWKTDCSCWPLLLDTCTHNRTTMFGKNHMHLMTSLHLKLEITPSTQYNYSINSILHIHLILSSLPYSNFCPCGTYICSTLPFSASDDTRACALSASELAGTKCYSMQCSSSNGRWPHFHSCSTATLQKLKMFPLAHCVISILFRAPKIRLCICHR
jgi:hypothetical protein